MTQTRIGLFALLAVWGAAQAPAKEYLHAKLKAKESGYKKILILPANVEISKQGVKGAEGMGKESEEAAAAFGRGVSEGLTKAGFGVEAPFGGAKDPELKAALADVQRKFDQISPQLYKKKKDVEKGRFTVGDSVNNVNQVNADAVVMVRAFGVKQTKGKAFLGGGLLGMALSNPVTYHFYITLVDSKSGDVMFLSEMFSRGLPKDDAIQHSLAKVKGGK